MQTSVYVDVVGYLDKTTCLMDVCMRTWRSDQGRVVGLASTSFIRGRTLSKDGTVPTSGFRICCLAVRKVLA